MAPPEPTGMPGESVAPRHPPSHVPKDELEIRGLSAGYGERVLLDIDTLSIPDSGIVGLIGSSGGGKSTLLRLLAGTPPADADFWVQHEGASWSPRPGDGHGPPGNGVFLLDQHARLPSGPVIPSLQRACGASDARDVRRGVGRILEEFELGHDLSGLLHGDAAMLSYGQQKLLLIAAFCCRQPERLFLDEPTRSMSTTEEGDLLRVLDRLRDLCPVLMISHDKEFIRSSCDHVILLAGGMVEEQARCRDFFEKPATPVGRAFLKAGSAWPLIDAGDRLTDRSPATKTAKKTDGQQGNGGVAVTWVLDRLLGGCPMPGLLGEQGVDLAGLREQGVDVLITLTEEPLSCDSMVAQQMQGLHFPIVDMDIPPDMAALANLIRHVESCVENGVAVVFHCRAGLGRTGLMLACTLVKLGFEPDSAIEKVRSRESRMIQTDGQATFVCDYAAYLEASAPHTSPS